MLNNLPTDRVTPALRFLAAEARMSQERLAAKVGLSQSAVGRRLSGDTPINIDDVARFAAAMGYEVTVTFSPRIEAVAS